MLRCDTIVLAGGADQSRSGDECGRGVQHGPSSHRRAGVLLEWRRGTHEYSLNQPLAMFGRVRTLRQVEEMLPSLLTPEVAPDAIGVPSSLITNS
jgi:hypothetical protein